MTKLTIGVLKNIIEHMPDDYTIEFTNGKNDYTVNDKIEIDVTLKKLILRKF